MRINGFEQIKAFYSWSFSHQEKGIKPQHMSLYLFLINQNNRNNWIEWFKVPFDLAMAGSCISSKKTYYNCLSDLQDWKLIQYQKGVNNWKSPLIKLEVLKDTSTVPQSAPQSEPQLLQASIPQHIQALIQAATPQPIPNIKQLTLNLKLITDNIDSIIKEQKKKSASPPTPKKIKLVRSPEDLKEVARLSFENNQCTFENEFKKAWIKLLNEKKWCSKSQSAIDISLKHLMEYDEVFAQILVEKAIAGDYQGVTFPSTKSDYQKFKNQTNGITKNITTADKTQSRNTMVELARQILSSNPAQESY